MLGGVVIINLIREGMSKSLYVTPFPNKCRTVSAIWIHADTISNGMLS